MPLHIAVGRCGLEMFLLFVGGLLTCGSRFCVAHDG